MNLLPNPKELDAILKICRKRGVDAIEIGAIKVKFGELPRETSLPEVEQETMPDGTPLPVGVTLEEMIHWSSAPDPLAMREESQQ